MPEIFVEDLILCEMRRSEPTTPPAEMLAKLASRGLIEFDDAGRPSLTATGAERAAWVEAGPEHDLRLQAVAAANGRLSIQAVPGASPLHIDGGRAVTIKA